MTLFSVRAQREAAVWDAVAAVNDPELDEPVTEMGFVERIEVGEDGSVKLDFRLPTYWCSPNFAFLMLDDVRTALDALPWRPRHRITLHDHLFADAVNQGLAAGKPSPDNAAKGFCAMFLPPSVGIFDDLLIGDFSRTKFAELRYLQPPQRLRDFDQSISHRCTRRQRQHPCP